MELWEQLFLPETWQNFLQYKIEKQHLSHAEEKEVLSYIEKERYLPLLWAMQEPDYELPLPLKKEINKVGTSKKRVVYSFPREFGMLLKLMTYLLGRYDGMFGDNCYAFRKHYGVRDAVQRLRLIKGLSEKYCLKVDISNYFNSIPVPELLEKLAFMQEEDGKLYTFIEKLLTADRAIAGDGEKKLVIVEKRGAMAGIPLSPFFANVYLMDVDRYFEEQQVPYFRYSDDILLFADSEEELDKQKETLFQMIEAHGLRLNPAKVKLTGPGEPMEFLGFCFYENRVDLSVVTIQKIKDKIKRKAHALRKWQQKKGLTGDRAAKGFIRAMNHKFYDSGDGTEFSWSRWFFPCLTSDAGLREIDAYMQQYIRYCVTGRHYKGNYRITYEEMKAWGYRSLVHEYYLGKSQ